MKRLSWPAVALVAVLGAAFVVQATSTWRLGERQHLADLALPALVVLLEVGSITTAAIFFSARSKGLRVRALLLLAVTAGLGGLGGVVAYGVVIGVPVAILMLGLVEVIGTYRREQRSTPVEESTTSDHVDREPVEEQPKRFEPVPVVDQGPTFDRRLFEPVWPRGGGDEPFTVRPRPEPFVDPTPTEPLDRAEDGRPLDVVEPEEPIDDDQEPIDEAWRDHETTEQEMAAVILDHLPRDGKRLTERQLSTALIAAGFPERGSRYRSKKYLGNATSRRLEAVG